MSLPHFNNGIVYDADVIYENAIRYSFNIDKNDNEFLSDNIVKFYNDKILFNLNIVKGKIKLFNILLKYLNKEISVFVSYYDKLGNILYEFTINDFIFTKLPNLITVDYSNSGLKEIIAEYKFKDVNAIDCSNQRRMKLNKLLNLEEKSIIINNGNII